MNSGLDANDQVVVAAFRAALIHQGFLALLIFGLVSAVWTAAGGRLAPSHDTAGRGAAQAAWAAEPAGRRLLRLGFGLLWIFDGMLQAQPAMAVGLPSQVMQPEAASSPGWVQHVVNWGGATWSYHPVQAAAAAVWIQVGIGIWLMAAAEGPWSRLAGLASAGWGRREPTRAPPPPARAGVTGSGRSRCAGRSAPRARARWSRPGPSG